MDKKKILAAAIASTVGFGAFTMSLSYIDIDTVVSEYKNTVNGDFWQKTLTVTGGNSNNTSGGQGNNSGSGNSSHGASYVEKPLPEELSVENIKAWIREQNINDDRKALLTYAADMIGKADYKCTSEAHGHWVLDDLTGKTIECSGFVAWCYNKIKYNVFGGPNTGSIKNYYELTTSPIPGDVGNVTAAERGKSSGHATIYLGKKSNGAIVYIHAGSGKVPVAGEHSDVTDKGHMYIHPDMKKKDAEYYSSSDSASGNIQAGESTFKVADAKGCKVADYEFHRFNASSNRKNKLIVLDPGHGPANIRSIVTDFSEGEYYSIRGGNYGGEIEEEFALDIALRAKDLLVAQGFDVILTRYTKNDIVPNKLRAVMANEVNADLAVNIHWNGADGSARGACMVLPSDYASRPWYNTAKSIWDIMNPKFAEHLGASMRSDYVSQTKLAFFNVIQVPTVYIETGFADNAEDIKKLVGEENHQAIAQIICDGITQYYSN